MAGLAHQAGHPDAGRLMATYVDRLLVWDRRPQRYGTQRRYKAGEPVLFAMEAGVTDEERIGLGLPSLAELRGGIEAERKNAARRIATEGLPEGAHLARVERHDGATELSAALGGSDQAVFRDGEDMVFCWRGEAEAVTASFGTEMDMERLPGTDLWHLAVRVRDLDRAAISYRFMPGLDGVEATPTSSFGRWRGPQAPPEPARAKPVRGEIRELTIDSMALGEQRRIQVYLPPGHDPRGQHPVVYGADAGPFPSIVEPLILAGAIPPLICVGTRPFPGREPGDRRNEEYTPFFCPERYDAHRRFFVEEVTARKGGAPRHYLCAGTLEEALRRQSALWAERAGAAGAEIVQRSWVSGHDMVMWEAELPAALTWAFG
ncbi:MAG: enterochelin esterase domain-containing protein, partial [Acidimicrobiales bacterium]